MSVRDLCDKYNNGKNCNTQRLVNRAIRAEIPGGRELIDLTRPAGRNPRGFNKAAFCSLLKE